ncbi:MAG: hypothetical protein QXI33_01695 [Candidatus Pacearchaeota archaeon]
MVKKKYKDKINLIEEDNFLAFITTFLSIVGFILAITLWNDKEYVMFYAKQSLVIFIVLIIGYGTSLIPLIGSFISVVVYSFFIIFWIMSWIFALSGEKKGVFFISDYAKKLKI